MSTGDRKAWVATLRTCPHWSRTNGPCDECILGLLDAHVVTLTAENARLRILFDRADGALADAETVQTDDLERGIRQLANERDGLYQKFREWEARCHEAEARAAGLEAANERLRELVQDMLWASGAGHSIEQYRERARDALTPTAPRPGGGQG